MNEFEYKTVAERGPRDISLGTEIFGLSGIF